MNNLEHCRRKAFSVPVDDNFFMPFYLFDEYAKVSFNFLDVVLKSLKDRVS